MQTSANEIIEITEGQTKILVPSGSVSEEVPPKDPAFYNPRARLNRDFSIIAYSAFIKNFKGPKIFLDGLSGVGARALRVANEIKGFEKIITNDVNSKALQLSAKSALLNDIKNFETSENEVCRFFSLYSKKDCRGSIVDVDPFGSPAKYVDCAIRATMHGGLMSTTATDLQVLHGLFQSACKRRYYGTPVKTEYGNEIAIRLILGCIYIIAARLDIQIVPMFVDASMHYYRTYVKILSKPDQKENLGYILHCKSCGNRKAIINQDDSCNLCNSKVELAGPLWIGQLFDKKFVQTMLDEVKHFSVSKQCEKTLQKADLESEMPVTYFTLDEIASMMKITPLSMKNAIERLQQNGFKASPTSLNPTGFRTNAQINDIVKIFSD